MLILPMPFGAFQPQKPENRILADVSQIAVFGNHNAKVGAPVGTIDFQLPMNPETSENRLQFAWKSDSPCYRQLNLGSVKRKPTSGIRVYFLRRSRGGSESGDRRT